MKLTSKQIAEIIHSCTSRIPRIDGSLPDLWCDLSETTKEHASNAVEEIMSGPPRSPKELHDLWMQPLLENDWTQGDYSFENKKHPSLVPFQELPESEILKDELWHHLTECFRKYYTTNEEEAFDLY